MTDLEPLELIVKSLLLSDPDKTNTLLFIETNIVRLSRMNHQEGVMLFSSLKKLYLNNKLANPESIARAARKLRERARAGQESNKLLPSDERVEIIEKEELKFKTYSLADAKARDINERLEW